MLGWMHRLIISRGYSGWVGDQAPTHAFASTIVAKDVSTAPPRTRPAIPDDD